MDDWWDEASIMKFKYICIANSFINIIKEKEL